MQVVLLPAWAPFGVFVFSLLAESLGTMEAVRLPWVYPVPSTGLDQRGTPERSAGGVVWLRDMGLTVTSEEEIPGLGPLVLSMAILKAVCAPGRPLLF